MTTDSPISTEAVVAAARAINSDYDLYDRVPDWIHDRARRVLAAAFPHIREALAAEIMTARGDVDPGEQVMYVRGVAYGMAAAARIVRGTDQ